MRLAELVMALSRGLRQPPRVIDLGNGQHWRLVRGSWRLEADTATPAEREQLIDRYRKAGLL